MTDPCHDCGKPDARHRWDWGRDKVMLCFECFMTRVMRMLDVL